MADNLGNVILDLFVTIFGMVKAIFLAVFRVFISPPEKSVSGSVVLLTGGGSGIGRLIAQELAGLGATVVSWDVNESGNQETLKLIEEAGGKCHVYTVDVSERELIEECAKKVEQEVGNVDILVNNAGIVYGRKFMDLSDEMIIKTFDVNLFAHFWTVKTFLPKMIARGSGHIVNIASVAGVVGTNRLTDYCASKFANIGFTEALGNEIVAGQYNINVTTVCPYFINTGMFHGCVNRFPRLLPSLEPDYTAKRIVKAILTNQKVVYIPRIMYFLATIKTILPVDAFILLHKFLGATNFMDSFIGRTKKD